MANIVRNNPLSRYLRGSWEELKKVTWPTRQEAWRKAWIVIAFSAVFVVFLGGLDYILSQLIDVFV